MIGGGKQAFIGAVHRMAANLDGLIELSCGAFSSNPETSKTSGEELFIPANRIYGSYKELFEKENQNGIKKKNYFTAKSKSYQFLGNNGSIIQLNYYKYHRYETEKSIDSIWENYRKQITESKYYNLPLNEMSVGHYMTKNVICVSPNDSIFDVADKFLSSKKRNFPGRKGI